MQSSYCYWILDINLIFICSCVVCIQICICPLVYDSAYMSVRLLLWILYFLNLNLLMNAKFIFFLAMRSYRYTSWFFFFNSTYIMPMIFCFWVNFYSYIGSWVILYCLAYIYHTTIQGWSEGCWYYPNKALLLNS